MQAKLPPPAWRSILFVPANVRKFVDKATSRGADALLLDVEDSVDMAQKEDARRQLPEAIEILRRGRADIGVRINRPLDLAVRDIEAAVMPGLSFLSITKVAGPQHVQLVSELVSDLEERRGIPHGTVRLVVNVETADAYWQMHEIARSDFRVVALALGTEDFCLDSGMQPTADALLVPKQQTAIAARAGKLLPIGYVGTVARFSDLDGFRAMVRRSQALGFACGYAIHPSQVPILNAEFGPSEADIAGANAIVNAASEARDQGIGAFVVDGRMVDKPIIERAERLLSRAGAIAALQMPAN
jgi:citrate lyase subunit beta/citryl-CoA lyase